MMDEMIDNGYHRETSHSMLRRAQNWDYKGRGIYMLTLVVEGREPLLGSLLEDEQGTFVKPSVLGEAVLLAVENIPSFYPQLRILGKQLMPDHLHFCLYVTEPLPVHLGRVINGFKQGTNRTYWQQIGAPDHRWQREERNSHCNSASTEHLTPACNKQDTGHQQQVSCSPAVTAVREHHAAGKESPLKGFWQAGYHDRILFHEGQLDRMLTYIKDNPRRLMEKRKHPEYFTIRRELNLAGHQFATIGNIHLLNRPNLLQVQCSRRLTQEQINQEKAAFLEAGKRGSVLVSPCISEGEKQIARAAIDAGMPLIVLLENGFAPMYKPTGKYFNACTEGCLLMLAPWEHHTDKRTITLEQCLALNEMARQICNL